MNVVVVGYGRMGHAVEEAAVARGHRIVARIDPAASGAGIARRIGPATLRDAQVAVEFTGPVSAEDNVCDLLSAGLPVVCGSTGWGGPTPRVESTVRDSGCGAVFAPNFSLGVQLFYAVVAEAARTVLASGRYEPWILEAHHSRKLDAPSGTARRLAAILGPGEVPISSIRAGQEPGRHTVGFDGTEDAITLTHQARGRAGFALGAVLAAEWILGRTGIHGFDEVVADLLQKGRQSS